MTNFVASDSRFILESYFLGDNTGQHFYERNNPIQQRIVTNDLGYFEGHNGRLRAEAGTAREDPYIIQSEVLGRGIIARSSPYKIKALSIIKSNLPAGKARIERPNHITFRMYGSNGMFKTRDKLPYISWVKMLDGTKIEGANLILFGVSYDNLLKVDSRGIAAGYLPIDTYSQGRVISSNALVYDLVQQNELHPYIYDSYFRRATKGNPPYIQIHRKFI
jgi:hypothetical protein